MGKVRKSRVHKGIVERQGFESQSIKVTSESLVNNRKKERLVSEAETFHLGIFMKNLVERKHQMMNTTASNISHGFFSSRGGDQKSMNNNDTFLMNQTLMNNTATNGFGSVDNTILESLEEVSPENEKMNTSSQTKRKSHLSQGKK